MLREYKIKVAYLHQNIRMIDEFEGKLAHNNNKSNSKNKSNSMYELSFSKMKFHCIAIRQALLGKQQIMKQENNLTPMSNKEILIQHPENYYLPPLF